MDRGLPTGTVSMLFTDIESSTVLLRRLGDRYGEALVAQRGIIREAVAASDGHELGTEGDSFFVVFRSAIAAVTAAVSAQRGLLNHRWPDGHPVRVRMGLHTGEPLRHEDNYVGIDVHRAARIAASAAGGQVVCSEATHSLVASSLPDGVSASDLGWHRFKDLIEPERVYQVCAEGLPRDFPPLRSLGTRVSLPTPLTTRVGRTEELADITQLLASAGARLVTLTGPGGTGKSRLAIEAARSLADVYADGVYFVPLASVTTVEVMWSTIAEVLGVTGEGRAPPTFFEHIAGRQALLVMDNLEQLEGAAAGVEELLASAPQLAVIATTRRPLRLTCEFERPVAPLDVPADPDASPDEASGFSGVQLFVERARQVRPSFELGADNVADVVALIRELDGLPLAVELAAARLRLLGPAGLRKRLRQALWATGPQRGRPERHASLRNTIAWSYELLTPDEQEAFRRLGVFSGGGDLDAAAAVVAPEGDVLTLIEGLIDTSLVTVREGADGEPRIGLLQTIGTYARDQLAERAELDETARRHAEHYTGLVETLVPMLRSDRHLLTRDRLESELANIRAALTWSLDDSTDGAGDEAAQQRLSLGLSLCRAMSWFWYSGGYLAEGRQWLGLAIERTHGRESPESMAALHGLGILLLQQGQHAEGAVMLERALAFWRRTGDDSRTAMELNSLAVAHRSMGEPDEAERLARESAELARKIGERNRLANALSNLALLEVDADRPEAAIELLHETLEIDRELGDAWGVAIDQVNLAGAMLRADRVDDAEAQLTEVAREAVALSDIELTIGILELFCMLHAERGDAAMAARLLGTTTTMREQAELPLVGPEAAMLERSLAKIRPDGDADEHWRTAVEEGTEWSVETALSAVLDG